jgi:D-alanyl-lipoteichoic acid acyltransferase DltB (MBOAT superfamily)
MGAVAVQQILTERRWVGSLRRFPIASFAQLAAFTALVYLFRIENHHLLRVFEVALGGFIVYHLAPYPYRHAIFLLASMVAGTVTVGPLATVGMAAIAGLTLGIGALPIRLRYQLLLLTVLLGIFGYGASHSQVRAPVEHRLGPHFWAIAGSIFSFRSLMYLYDTAMGLTAVPLAQRMSYFLLLPNFSMSLFPLVDYRTFVTKHSHEQAQETCALGGRMLLVGFVHLLGYRLVYHYMHVDPSNAKDLSSRLAYVFGFYLLYLRVSGLFHVVIGLLHFFGYRLPPTHDRHLLSTGFGDFWRRTNVYWRDFNQKYVFSPVVLWLQRRMTRGSLQVAVFISLVVSWAIHSYQMFFLTGEPYFTLQDELFWLILAFAMVFSATMEQRKPQRGRLHAKRKVTAGERVAVAVRTLGFFVLISVLWSFWSAASIKEWTTVVLGRTL